MYRARPAVLSLLIFLCFGSTFAQSHGLLPSHVRWMRLHHDSLDVLFPQGEETKARRVASLMLRLAATDPITAHSRYKPIAVLLQPQTNISNGYVGLAPYVSEFYLEPHENPFELGSLPWTDLLALHEYRHVQQVNAANTGISHLVKLIFGDLVFSGFYALSVPNWYREGDAVLTETKWTSQGRGRLSQFTLPFFQKAMEGDPWDYYKVRNGSYKEFTPDYYALGYMMITYGNQFFGEDPWDTIMHHAPRFKHLFNPFSGLVRDYYGKSNKGLYLDAMRCYRDECNVLRVPDVRYPTIPLRKQDFDRDYFDMTYPVVDEDGNVYAAITTFDRTTGIYRIDPGGNHTRIISMGWQKDSYFHYRHHRFVWTELRFDPRWLRKDESVIVVYDEEKKKRSIIRPEKGYFTPSLDEQGTRIVALHESATGHYTLRILDAVSGTLLRELPNPENRYLGYPVFGSDGTSVIATARNAKGQMCLLRQDILTGEFRKLTEESYSILGKPFEFGRWILLTTGVSMLNQVFAVDQQDGLFYQVSSGNNTHYDPVWDPAHHVILCSEYRLNGKKLVMLPGDPAQWKLTSLSDGIRDFSGLAGRDLLQEPDRTEGFEVRRYSSWAEPVHFHSWIVTANDPVWGVEARSDNKLNTVSLAAGYDYNRNTKAKGPYLGVTLSMYYPQLTFGISRNTRELRDNQDRQYKRYLDEIYGGIALPLRFTHHVYSQTLLLSTTYSAGFRSLKPELPGENYDFNYLHSRLVLINSRKLAFRQSMPTWGQRLDVSFSHQVSGIPISQLYLATDLALPSFTPSHYIHVQGEALVQELEEGSLQLNSSFAGARGFPYVEGEKQYRLGITYGFPVWYPDRGLGNIFYTRRIRLQPFFDMAYVRGAANKEEMTSAGMEMILDFKFPPVSVGIRYARLLSGQFGNANQFEFFIPAQRF